MGRIGQKGCDQQVQPTVHSFIRWSVNCHSCNAQETHFSNILLDVFEGPAVVTSILGVTIVVIRSSSAVYHAICVCLVSIVQYRRVHSQLTDCSSTTKATALWISPNSIIKSRLNGGGIIIKVCRDPQDGI